MRRAAKGVTWSSSEKPESCTLLRAKEARVEEPKPKARTKSQSKEPEPKPRATKAITSRAEDKMVSKPIVSM